MVWAELALKIGSKLWEAIEKELGERLTKEERFLILKTGSGRQGVIGIATDMQGSYVYVNNESLRNETDPSYAAVYRDAFCSLIDKGLLEPIKIGNPVGGYTLSRKEHEIYKKIASK